MLPTQNMMEDCDFSGVSDVPTIFNFTMALGKTVGIIDMDAINKFSDRNVLNISSLWSRDIFIQKKCEYRVESHIINGILYNIYRSIRYECADLGAEETFMMDPL